VSTRCSITAKDPWGRYRIYRHSDGYPTGVVPDLYLVWTKNTRHDAEYFLANFVFYSKLRTYLVAKKFVTLDKEPFKDYIEAIKAFRSWELGYGVCRPDCKHGDLEYEYELDTETGNLQIYDVCEDRIIFDGPIDEAYKKYGSEFPNGCHIDVSVFV